MEASEHGHHAQKEGKDGAYAIAGAFLISAIILSAAIIYAVGNLNGSLQQVQQGITEVKVALANAPSVAAAPAAPQRVQPTTQPPAATPPPQPQPKGKVLLQDAVSKGSEDAKYALVEYSDFQCPFCQRFFQQTEAQLFTDYVDTGKVRFVYKHFPLDSIHPNARPAAQASECARDQGKFWEMHDKIFEKSPDIGSASLKQMAAELKMDTAKFNACLDSGEKNAVVEAQLQEGIQNGIGGTPGFLLVDDKGNVLQVVSGAQPYSVFQQLFSSVGI